MATSNLDWMSLRTSSLSSDATKVMASPLVPKRPARLRTNSLVDPYFEPKRRRRTRLGEGKNRHLQGCRS